MILIKYVDAWDQLLSMSAEDGTGRLSKLAKDVQDRGAESALDNVVVETFPNGVEEDELREFFMNKDARIRRSLFEGAGDASSDVMACLGFEDGAK